MSRNVPFGKLSTQRLKFWLNAKLTARDWLVWMALVSHADWQGIVFQTQTKIAEVIGLDRSNFGKSVRRLKKVGAIKPRGEYFQLCPTLIEYGDWASAKEVAGRKARKECYLAGDGADQARVHKGQSVKDAPAASQKAQWEAVSFPQEQKQSHLSGSGPA